MRYVFGRHYVWLNTCRKYSCIHVRIHPATVISRHISKHVHHVWQMMTDDMWGHCPNIYGTDCTRTTFSTTIKSDVGVGIIILPYYEMWSLIQCAIFHFIPNFLLLCFLTTQTCGFFLSEYCHSFHQAWLCFIENAIQNILYVWTTYREPTFKQHLESLKASPFLLRWRTEILCRCIWSSSSISPAACSRSLTTPIAYKRWHKGNHKLN